MSSRNYYQVLEVNPLASQKTIRSAYRTLMFKCRCHPDLGGSEALAREINEAYDVLYNPEKRKAYDLKLGTDFLKNAAREPPERRRIPRVYVNLTVSFRKAGGGFEPAKIADISSLGCRLQTKDMLEKGVMVTVNVAGHVVEGVVRWKRMFHPSIFQRIFEAGIEFTREFEEIDKITLFKNH